MNKPNIDDIEVEFTVINPKEKEVYDNFPNEADVLFIIKNVEKHNEISCVKFYSTSRVRKLVLSRQLCMYFLHKYTPHGTTTIASWFKSEAQYKNEGKNHTTVLHAERTINNLVDTNKPVRNVFNLIKRDILLFQNEELRFNDDDSKLKIFSKILKKYVESDEEKDSLLSDYINCK